MRKSGFTLIELLVVVAIIGILAAVGVVAYNGYTNSAKKSALKSNHSNVVKYIITETTRCSIGETTAMDGNLDCSKQSEQTWKDFVAKAVEKSLSEFKNPYDTTKTAITHGGDITNDNDVGYIRMRSPGTKIEVMSCVQTPCAGTRCTMPNHLCSGEINLN